MKQKLVQNVSQKYSGEYVDTSNDNGSDSEIIEQNTVFEKTLDAATNFKDALLASLYAQVEFLKTELEEKNLLIRTLILKDSEVVCNDYNSSNSDSSSEVAEIDLYLQFIRFTEEERSKEINIVQLVCCKNSHTL